MLIHQSVTIPQEEYDTLVRSHEVIKELLSYDGITGIRKFKDSIFHLICERITLDYQTVNPDRIDDLVVIFMVLQQIERLEELPVS